MSDHSIPRRLVYQLTSRLLSQVCEVCAATSTVAHHPDYSRPLDVVWLCRSCHHLIHIYSGIPWAALSAALFLRSEGLPATHVARLTGLSAHIVRRWSREG